ncbi:MAG: nucleoside-triphosphatase [Candidatus Nanoarchaeia archaeon]
MKTNILITGIPRSGKSTALRKAISDLSPKVGFVTNEVREHGERSGFEIETYNRQRATLASLHLPTPYKVPRHSVPGSYYYLQPDSLEAILPGIQTFTPEDLLYIDELGQMQLGSEKLQQTAQCYLDAPNTALFTISAVYSHPFIDLVKQRNDSILVQITEETREQQQTYIGKLIGKIAKAKKYATESERFLPYREETVLVSEHGRRTLTKKGEEWNCDCDFHKKHDLCSHSMALEAVIQQHSLSRNL